MHSQEILLFTDLACLLWRHFQDSEILYLLQEPVHKPQQHYGSSKGSERHGRRRLHWYGWWIRTWQLRHVSFQLRKLFRLPFRLLVSEYTFLRIHTACRSIIPATIFLLSFFCVSLPPLPLHLFLYLTSPPPSFLFLFFFISRRLPFCPQSLQGW